MSLDLEKVLIYFSTLTVLVPVFFMHSTCNSESISRNLVLNSIKMDSIVQPNTQSFFRESSERFVKLSKKYGFLDYGFDREFDYAKDFELIILEIAKLAFKDIVLIESGTTEDEAQVFSKILVFGKEYIFYSGNRNWIETKGILRIFNEIALENNLDIIISQDTGISGGNLAVFVVADKRLLKEAIKKGFPCCSYYTPSIYKDAKILPNSFDEIEVIFDGIPHFDSLRVPFINELNFLGKKVNPQFEDFTIKQIALVEGLKASRMIIYINCIDVARVKLEENVFIIKDSDFQLGLLYTMAKHFDCNIFFVGKNSDERIQKNKSEVLKLIEDAFSV
ncbi:MAG: hypothetical protein DHS20C18_14640 [Saprospiraceae bacterium]|nr:MAG: hypothetical protein DHS20C18_14640 [Saprospiraceae bacterium]